MEEELKGTIKGAKDTRGFFLAPRVAIN